MDGVILRHPQTPLWATPAPPLVETPVRATVTSKTRSGLSPPHPQRILNALPPDGPFRSFFALHTPLGGGATAPKPRPDPLAPDDGDDRDATTRRTSFDGDDPGGCRRLGTSFAYDDDSQV